jgi:hypothetical protein
LIRAEAVEETEVVVDGGGDEEEAVETVEEAAMAREGGAHVFDAQVAFHGR